MVSLYIGAYYNTATSLPVKCALVGSVAGVSPYFNIVSTRAGAFDTQAFTCLSGVLSTAGETFFMRLSDTTYLNQLDQNTKMVIQRIQ